MWIGLSSGVLLTVIAPIGLVVGDFSLRWWLLIPVGPLLVIRFAGVALGAGRHPVVRITGTDVAIRPIGSRVCQVARLSELTGLRWQDPFDLRLCSRSGIEYSIQIRQIARQERQRLQVALQESIDGARTVH